MGGKRGDGKEEGILVQHLSFADVELLPLAFPCSYASPFFVFIDFLVHWARHGD